MLLTSEANHCEAEPNHTWGKLFMQIHTKNLNLLINTKNKPQGPKQKFFLKDQHGCALALHRGHSAFLLSTCCICVLSPGVRMISIRLRDSFSFSWLFCFSRAFWAPWKHVCIGCISINFYSGQLNSYTNKHKCKTMNSTSGGRFGGTNTHLRVKSWILFKFHIPSFFTLCFGLIYAPKALG